MARDREETHWTRHLLVAVGALAAVALVIGGVVSVVAIGAAQVAGLGSGGPSVAQAPSLYLPSGTPTVKLDPYRGPTLRPRPTTATPSPTASRSASPTPRVWPITLQAFPQQVAPGQRINLTGIYQGADGASLQVQQFEGGWTDFPVTVTVNGGLFTTYIITGHTGPNRFRVINRATNQASNPVRVKIG